MALPSSTPFEVSVGFCCSKARSSKYRVALPKKCLHNHLLQLMHVCERLLIGAEDGMPILLLSHFDSALGTTPESTAAHTNRPYIKESVSSRAGCLYFLGSLRSAPHSEREREP